MSDHARKRGRLAIYAMAGVFVLSEAYNLMKALPTATEYRGLMTAFIFIFGILGVAMVVGGLFGSYKLMKANANGQSASSEEISSEDAESIEMSESEADTPSLPEESEHSEE